MTRKLAIRLSLLSSIIYIALTILYFTSVISKFNHSDSPSAGAGLGMLLAFLIPHYFMLLIAVIFNIVISLIKFTKNYLIIINIILYIIAGALGFILGFILIISIIFQIIFLIIAYNK
ncbi:hypothetical protein [Gemella haemolysans]|jgi:hypothetical protein|uniref:Uncharacterized protein n=2 Tax=Gemella haemolysans TaxID=1379 RepID=A0AA87DVR0_9BACL|nr:hypothetical protein [Gemella haemolysans]EGF88610.1 hypothetical protein HMPREF0428_00888 [Gemella haemolysans M341]QIX88236.1 hypothetical protein FOC48_05415 [Gemella haemolysans]